ncbi:MAG: hypothetical protein HY848_12495 [Betaproteobacteria bacterium]|nr:hypothetical protein [Betaproteobacteria bacterium]
MSDLPKFGQIREVGPRKGFQFEKQPISTADNIAFVDASSDTGVKAIEFVSYRFALGNCLHSAAVWPAA